MPISRRRLLTGTAAAAGAAAMAPLIYTGTAAQSSPSQPDLRSWDGVRSQFVLDPSYTHAALFFIASHPRPVREAIDRYRNEIDRNPFLAVEHGVFSYEPAENHMARVHAALAGYIGGQPDDIALTSNTTSGLALVYNGLPLRRGDEILTTTHDHYSHHESIRYAAERAGATWRKVPMFDSFAEVSQDRIVHNLRKEVRANTRVLGVTWVHSSTGIRLPLERLAEMVRSVNARRTERDRLLLVVDGVHGIGAESSKIAATGVDVFAAGLHKWMLAPRGTGFVWARPEVWASMRPMIPTFSAEEPYAAWAEGRAWRGSPRATWMSPGGFESYEHFWAIEDAIGFLQNIGPDRITARVHELNGSAKRELAKMSHVKVHTPVADELSAGIICFDVEGMRPADVVAKLAERRIIASTSPYAITYPRLSFGIANSENDVETCVRAVAALSA